MRHTSVKVSVSTILLIVLLAAVPAEARQQRSSSPEVRESQAIRIVKMIRQAMARTFGPIAQALPTIPIPAPSNPTEEERTASPTPLPVDEYQK